jgi:nucleolar protein 58
MHWFVIGYRTSAVELDLSDILPADVEAQVKEAAEISMGTEISEEDITNIRHLCSQVCLVESINSIEFYVRISLRESRPIIYDDVSYRPSLN